MNSLYLGNELEVICFFNNLSSEIKPCNSIKLNSIISGYIWSSKRRLFTIECDCIENNCGTMFSCLWHRVTKIDFVLKVLYGFLWANIWNKKLPKWYGVWMFSSASWKGSTTLKLNSEIRSVLLQIVDLIWIFSWWFHLFYCCDSWTVLSDYRFFEFEQLIY